MLRRILSRILARPVASDVTRLLISHGRDALFMARHAAMAAREGGRAGHWSRVLRKVETRARYRPW